jgi:hypothetical protein
MTCNAQLLLASLTTICLALSPATSLAQNDPPEVGLFFDQTGDACNAILEPFAPLGAPAHILAFVESGFELGGAFIRMELPPFLQIRDGSIRWPKNTDAKGSLTSGEGLDLSFQVCPTSTGEPITLVSFVLEDVNFVGVRPDLEVKILGGTITAPDTLTLKEPNLKVCDPDHPEGYIDLVVAPSTLATLNCSAGDCPCNETAVSSTTWTAVRRLYADD